MNSPTLQDLTLSSFKGIASFSTTLSGQSANVFGRNGAGKSTLAAAFLWLLTGKDANGRADYQIKPLAPDGETIHHGVEPTVSATFQMPDGHPLKLTRTLQEKWATARGRSAKEYRGDETRCYIDDVPTSVTEYARFIAKTFAPEPVLRLLTSTGYFNTQIDNAARRKLLLETFGDMSDEDILAAAPHFAPLLEKKGRRSVPEFGRMMEEQRKKANEEIDKLPIRIDEAQKQIVPVDVVASTKELSKVAVELAKKRQALATAPDAAVQSLQRDHEQKQAALASKQAEAQAVQRQHIAEQQRRQSGIIAAAKSAVSTATQLAEDTAQRVLLNQNRAANASEALQTARSAWQTLNAETFEPDTTCPTCGQPFAEERLAEMEANWNEARAKELQRLTAEGQQAKAAHEEATQNLAAAMVNDKTAQQALANAQEALKAAEQAPVTNEPDEALQREFEADIAHLQQQADEAAAALAKARQQPEEDAGRAILQGEIEALEARQKELQAQILQDEQNQTAQRRIEEYQTGQRAQLATRDEAEQMLALCETFTREKVGLVTGQINSHFALVEFKLFENQKNGGLKLVCEATVDGVPFESLNRARRLAASLDIITTFSRALGIRLPLFIDDAEGVYETYGISMEGWQTITLYATETDEALRIQPLPTG